MSTSVNAATTASLQNLQSRYAAAMQQLTAITGGGGTTPAAPGTATAPTAGATPTTPAAAPEVASATNSVPGTFGPFPAKSGRSVMVTRDAGGKLSIPATGGTEAVAMGGKTVRFGPDGKNITAFQQIESYTFKVNLDHREGIATGLANLSRIFGARQERVKLLSNALADDANDSGTFDPVDLQKMSIETQTTQQLSEIQKKIFDSMTNAMQVWLR